MPWMAAGAGTPHSSHTVGSRSTLLDRRSTVLPALITPGRRSRSAVRSPES